MNWRATIQLRIVAVEVIAIIVVTSSASRPRRCRRHPSAMASAGTTAAHPNRNDERVSVARPPTLPAAIARPRVGDSAKRTSVYIHRQTSGTNSVSLRRMLDHGANFS